MNSYGTKIVESKALTASDVQFGSDIDCRGWAKIGILIVCDVNNSETIMELGSPGGMRKETCSKGVRFELISY